MTVSRVLYSSARGDWETPEALYEELNREFHFDFDPCPASPTFDGLSVAWHGSTYVNPPYGRGVGKWIEKALLEIEKGHASLVVFLLPARTDTVWFQDLLLPNAHEVRFLRGRLKFKGAKWSAPFPSMVVLLRSKASAERQDLSDDLDEGLEAPCITERIEGKALDHVKPPDADHEAATQEGIDCVVVGGYDSQTTGPGPVGKPSGTRAQPAKTFSDSEGASTPIDCEKVIERFRENTALLFKSGSQTAGVYIQQFRRFSRWAKLDRFTPKELMAKDRNGPAWQTVGGRLLLGYVRMGMPEVKKSSSRTVALAALKTVWVYGLGIPWPLDMRRDFGRTLHGSGARTTPKDEEIRSFFQAVEAESDAYLRSLMAVQLSCGLRSANHLARLDWRAVQYENGKPYAIVADGEEYNFKTRAKLVAYLPPLASEALAAWKAASKDTRDGSPIWPMRSCTGRVRSFTKPHTRSTLGRLFIRWKARHGIESPLTLMHFRHWVKRKAEQAGLDPSTADYLQQHQPKTDGGLSYGKVRDWETVIDEQRSKWPDGPLGFAFGPKVKVLDEDAPYLRLLADFKAGRLSELELAVAIAKVKTRAESGVLEP